MPRSTQPKMWVGPPAYTEGFEIHVEHLIDDASVVRLVHSCGEAVREFEREDGGGDDTLAAILLDCVQHQCGPVHRHENVRCEAILSAMENLRDAPPNGAPYTLNDVWNAAEGYIADGLSTCTCTP